MGEAIAGSRFRARVLPELEQRQLRVDGGGADRAFVGELVLANGFQLVFGGVRYPEPLDRHA